MDFTELIESLRNDIKHIIDVNASLCTLIRDEVIENEKGEKTYKKINKENVRVRFALMNTPIKNKEIMIGYNVDTKVYSLTAMFDEDIKIGDILKLKDGTLFKVLDIDEIYYMELDINYLYKKTGLAMRYII